MPLQLPRPSNPSSLPSLPSASSTSPPHPAPPRPRMRQPPPSFAHAQARLQARQLRGEGKSPFVPRRMSAGKERDLSDLSVHQLADMLERNAKLLDSPATFASLPGGDSRLRNQQQRIELRLKELQDVSQMKRDMDAVHIHSRNGEKDGKEEGEAGADGNKDEVKLEEDGEGEMEDVVENGLLDEVASPSAKRRIAAQLSRSPHSLSLSESIALQQAAVERTRDAQVKKEARMQLDKLRPTKTGELLKGAMGVDSALSDFMFAADSDEEPDDDEIDDWLNEGKKNVNGQLDEEEDAQLNPLRTAYMTGWEAAAQEEKGGG
ncbi:hypothetical protein JCM11641_002244 [Rhodosporidiobolus odoratus]